MFMLCHQRTKERHYWTAAVYKHDEMGTKSWEIDLAGNALANETSLRA
jgi:hypothetical protein